MGLLSNILCNGLTRAKALKWLRWASNSAGTATATAMAIYLRHHFSQFVGEADGLAIAGVFGAFVTGIVMSVGSAIYSIIDSNNVDAKIKIAAATGSITEANKPANVLAVKQATKQDVISAPSGTPEAMAQVQAVLKAGGE